MRMYRNPLLVYTGTKINPKKILRPILWRLRWIFLRWRHFRPIQFCHFLLVPKLSLRFITLLPYSKRHSWFTQWIRPRLLLFPLEPFLDVLYPLSIICEQLLRFLRNVHLSLPLRRVFFCALSRLLFRCFFITYYWLQISYFLWRALFWNF